MKKRIALGLVAVAAAGGLVWAAVRQDGMPSPKPEKQHEYLKQFEGTWDTHSKWMMGPGQEPTESKGTSTCTVKHGGLWLMFDYKGEMMSSTFSGSGMLGYDPQKKKFVQCWVDSMSTSLNLSEGTCDEQGKAITLSAERPDPRTGKNIKETQVWKAVDKDTFTLKFLLPGEGGKEMEIGSIEFKRHK